jgi:Secretion system C-terminal sorting domain
MTVENRDRVSYSTMIRQGLCLLTACMTLWSHAQTISEAEYFFDTDPGPGNGIPISFAAGDPVVITSTISTSGLQPGHHILFVRTRTSTGIWSLYEHQEFVIDGGVLEAEYFFDADPGIRNGTPISLSTNPGTFNTTISTAGLSDGGHVLFLRTLHDNNIWSLSDPQYFYTRVRIVEAEYFIDTDPGFGNGTPLSVGSPSDLISFSTTIATPVLPNGNHHLFIRTRDILGNWSLFEEQLFQVDTPLPIGLLDFTATGTQDGKVKLKWTTATETNNDFFTVEHATPGGEFAKILQKPGAGNSTKNIQYEGLHPNPALGLNYYRLKQTDFVGKTSYSKVVSIDMVPSPITKVYPNPIEGSWFVQFSDINQPRLLEIFDLTGNKLASYTIQGQNKFEFGRQTFSSGTYILRITSPNNEVEFHKLLFR